MAEENQADTNTGANQSDVPDNKDNSATVEATLAGSTEDGVAGTLTPGTNAADTAEGANGVKRAHRSQKVGSVVSDKMQKTVIVRVDRLVRHTKYRRYVRRTSKFLAHDELGATIGDKVKIVETRPMSARKRWRVIEIVQKAAK
jgi:small subunit ribosomal protein S17